MGAIVGPRRATRCATARVLCLCFALTLVASSPAHAQDPNQPKPPGLERIPGPMPTTAPDMLMLADVLVRGGHVVEARVLLQQVIDKFPDTGWQKWGYLGMGLLELARGRMTQARPYYQAAAVPGFSQDTALVVLALLDGQAGNPLGAAATLDAIAQDPARIPAAREAAAIGAGYVRYWAGDYEGAAIAFGAAAEQHPVSPLTDDMLYGLAQSFFALNDPESAEQVLERVNDMEPQGFDNQHVRPALRRLGLREILRATRQRYQAVPLGQPEQMLIALLDVNGRVLARGRLRTLAKQAKRAPAGSTLAKAAQDAQAALARTRKAKHLSTDMAMGKSPGPREGTATVTPAPEEPTPDTAPTDTVDETPPPATTSATSQTPVEKTEGDGGGLIVLLLLVGALVYVHRRWGIPSFFRRAASRPAGR
jgi:tetratricopeptide (TPR) repeat protein